MQQVKRECPCDHDLFSHPKIPSFSQGGSADQLPRPNDDRVDVLTLVALSPFFLKKKSPNPESDESEMACMAAGSSATRDLHCVKLSTGCRDPHGFLKHSLADGH